MRPFCAHAVAKQRISLWRLPCDRVAIVATIANLVCCRRRSQTLFAIELFGTPNRKPRLSSICDRLRLLRDYKGNLEETAEHWYPSAAKTTHETATDFGRSNCQMNCCRTQICSRNAMRRYPRSPLCPSITGSRSHRIFVIYWIFAKPA